MDPNFADMIKRILAEAEAADEALEALRAGYHEWVTVADPTPANLTFGAAVARVIALLPVPPG